VQPGGRGRDEVTRVDEIVHRLVDDAVELEGEAARPADPTDRLVHVVEDAVVHLAEVDLVVDRGALIPAIRLAVG
jgi:hypothetical protein